MPRHRIAPPLSVALLCAGCFSPEVNPEAGGSVSSATGSSGDQGTSGSSSTAGSSSGAGSQTTSGSSGSGNAADSTTLGVSPPTIESFSVDGVLDNPNLAVSGVYQLQVVAMDDKGVESANFYRDGALLGEGSSDGEGLFSLEWIVSGTADNGDTVLEVVVTDTDGEEAVAELIVQVELPNGGVVEGWDFDGGDGSSVWGISPNPDGDELVWVGNFWNGEVSLARIDRIEGPGWADVTASDSEFVIDARLLDDGGVLAAISYGTSFPRSTAIRRFSAAGSIVETEIIDGGPDPSADNYPLGLETDAEGQVYVLGSYAGDSLSSYLTKLGPDLDLEWQRDLTGSAATDGEPFAYDFDVSEGGTVAVVGARVVGTRKLWLATYNSEGSLLEQLTLTDEFPRSEGFDVVWTSDGDLVVTGATADTASGTEDWRWIVRKYDADLNPLWTQEGPNNLGFGQAIAADPFGNVISVVLETCDYNAAAFAYDACRLVVRKRDSDGNLVWQYQGASGEGDFAGPAFLFPGFKADVETDRFGYVYVTSLYRPSTGTNGVWWATKHNP